MILRLLPGSLWLNPFNAGLSPTEELLAGTENSGGGGKSRPYITLYCHHQNDSCIKMGSDESRSNVSLIVRGKVTKVVSTEHNFSKERRAEAVSNRGPSAY